jgi:thiamine biosynthesis lipoprotein
MGTTVEVGGASDAEAVSVEQLFAAYEQTFSPFRADSELSALNRAAGRFVPISPLLAEGLAVALRAAAETGGLVDPTIASPAGSGSWRAIRVIGRLARAPRDAAIDLNGVVKSMAVDAALALARGARLVSAGGDLAVRGALDVSLPGGGAVLLRRGALATSGTTRPGREHHLIDPATGRPVVTPWREVTACGATCLAADIAAKAGLVAAAEGPGWLDRRGIPARFVAHDGSPTCNAAWRESMRVALACT